jgi:hypothetical protein
LKKLTVIILTVIIAIGQWGYYSFYQIKIYNARQQAQEQLLNQIPQSQLTQIKLDNNTAICWEEEGKEFSINNEMYDVVRVEIKNGIKYLFCISDTKEDSIFKKMASFVKNNTQDNTSSKNLLQTKFQLNDIICNTYNNQIKDNYIHYTFHYFYSYTSKLTFTFSKVNTPPPKPLYLQQFCS